VFTGMPRKANKSAPKGTNSTARKQKKGRSIPPDPAQAPSQQPGSNKFVQDLLTRGEAAELTEDGKLPLRATHIIQKKPDGTAEVKRVRFKLF
jgi:hypothetical protein